MKVVFWASTLPRVVEAVSREANKGSRRFSVCLQLEPSAKTVDYSAAQLDEVLRVEATNLDALEKLMHTASSAAVPAAAHAGGPQSVEANSLTMLTTSPHWSGALASLDRAGQPAGAGGRMAAGASGAVGSAAAAGGVVLVLDLWGMLFSAEWDAWLDGLPAVVRKTTQTVVLCPNLWTGRWRTHPLLATAPGPFRAWSELLFARITRAFEVFWNSPGQVVFVQSAPTFELMEAVSGHHSLLPMKRLGLNFMPEDCHKHAARFVHYGTLAKTLLRVLRGEHALAPQGAGGESGVLVPEGEARSEWMCRVFGELAFNLRGGEPPTQAADTGSAATGGAKPQGADGNAAQSGSADLPKQSTLHSSSTLGRRSSGVASASGRSAGGGPLGAAGGTSSRKSWLDRWVLKCSWQAYCASAQPAGLASIPLGSVSLSTHSGSSQPLSRSVKARLLYFWGALEQSAAQNAPHGAQFPTGATDPTEASTPTSAAAAPAAPAGGGTGKAFEAVPAPDAYV